MTSKAGITFETGKWYKSDIYTNYFSKFLRERVRGGLFYSEKIDFVQNNVPLF